LRELAERPLTVPVGLAGRRSTFLLFKIFIFRNIDFSRGDFCVHGDDYKYVKYVWCGTVHVQLLCNTCVQHGSKVRVQAVRWVHLEAVGRCRRNWVILTDILENKAIEEESRL